jgi:hypothetical protein
MWKQFYEASALLHLPVFAMGIFMVLFVIAVARAWRTGPKTDPKALLPLTDDDTSMTSRSEA